MSASGDFILSDEVARVAPGEGLSILQLVNDETEQWQGASGRGGIEMTSVAACREGALVRRLAEHFGVPNLPAVVVFRDRSVVLVLPGPLTAATIEQLELSAGPHPASP